MWGKVGSLADADFYLKVKVGFLVGFLIKSVLTSPWKICIVSLEQSFDGFLILDACWLTNGLKRNSSLRLVELQNCSEIFRGNFGLLVFTLSV